MFKAYPLYMMPRNEHRSSNRGFWRALLEEGVYVNLAVPPATPSGDSLLRCSLSAAHDRAQLDKVVTAFGRVGERFGLLGRQKVAAIG